MLGLLNGVLSNGMLSSVYETSRRENNTSYGDKQNQFSGTSNVTSTLKD